MSCPQTDHRLSECSGVWSIWETGEGGEWGRCGGANDAGQAQTLPWRVTPPPQPPPLLQRLRSRWLPSSASYTFFIFPYIIKWFLRLHDPRIHPVTIPRTTSIPSLHCHRYPHGWTWTYCHTIACLISLLLLPSRPPTSPSAQSLSTYYPCHADPGPSHGKQSPLIF